MVWCDEVHPIRFAAHALWLLCHSSIRESDLRLVGELFWESSLHARASAECRWLDVPERDLASFRTEMAGYLVLRDLLRDSGLPHLDTLLQAKCGIQTFDPEEVGQIAPQLVTSLREESRWLAVRARAEDFLAVGRLEKVSDLLKENEKVTGQLIDATDAPVSLVGYVVRQAILKHCRDATPWPAWLARLPQHALLTRYERREQLLPAEEACAIMMKAAVDLRQVEDAIQQAPPPLATADNLLDWYVQSGHHALELRATEVFARLEAVDDPALHSAAYGFLMSPPNGLRYRVREFLNQLDRTLADFLRADPTKFMRGPRSAIRILPDLVRGRRLPPKARVWILVMDGMRYDTWDLVVRPLLAEHFEVVDGKDRPYFSLIPSKTDIARRGLLAANLGKDWKDYFNKPVKAERVLAARALGLGREDWSGRLAFITDAETTEARKKMGYNVEEGCDYNVLIYPISDDLGHYHNDTLSALNDKIRQQLLSQQGRRGIIDDLKRRVRPGDLVLVTSDHGFQELFPDEATIISRLDAHQSGAKEEDIAYRYLRFSPKKGNVPAESVTLEWEETGPGGRHDKTSYVLAVGGKWFQREGGYAARFAHGGISFAEMAIPGILLKLIEQKAARVEFAGLMSDLAVSEDDTEAFEFEISNVGNVDAHYHLVVETNLGDKLAEKQGLMASGKREIIHCHLTGRYEEDRDRTVIPEHTTTAVFLQLSHSDLSGKMIHPQYGRETIRVRVRPKETKIDTDALKAFDDV
jgi:hypothetical protein